MITVSVKNGVVLNVSGKPGLDLVRSEDPDHVSVHPDYIPYITPKLIVKEGDTVKRGSPLFYDKRDKRVFFVSPGGGRISEIRYGERRSISEIRITLAPSEEKRLTPAISETDMERMQRSDVVAAMLEGGVWPFLRSLPFRDMLPPDETPPALYVLLENQDPFHPSPELYLSGQERLFQFGLTLLKRLSPSVRVVKGATSILSIPKINEQITHVFSGAYPAHDPGVLVYRTRKNPVENRSGYVSGQDLLLIAGFFRNGEFPVARCVTVAGPLSQNPRTVQTRIGVPLSHILSLEEKKRDMRLIQGGLFNGHPVAMDEGMGLFESALTLMGRGDQKEFFGFARLGYNKPSHSKTFLSAFRKRAAFDMDCGVHGEKRACVNCGVCEKICPVDILPQFMMKALHGGEIEEALEHGLLDCAVCGLCTYVCPSKINLSDIFKKARTDYYKESK